MPLSWYCLVTTTKQPEKERHTFYDYNILKETKTDSFSDKQSPSYPRCG